MRTKTRNCTFNLIEVVLALMVVAIGIVGIMALFPVGLESNRDSVLRHNAGDAADQFLHFMAGELREDWTVAQAFPDTKPVVDEAEVLWSSDSLISDANVRIQFAAVNEGDTFDPAVHTQGVFRIEQLTPSQAVDFTGVLRVWKDETVYSDPRMNGGMMPWAVMDNSGGTDDVAFGFRYGQSYTLKYNAGGSTGWGASPGNFGALALGGEGADVYEPNIVSGYAGRISVGDTLITETGNMAGPTGRGLDGRLPLNPYIRVPVTTQFPDGRGEVTVIGMLPFKLIDNPAAHGGNWNAQVKAVYIGPEADTVPTAVDAKRILLKAEISWPEQVAYSERNKTVYSIEVFEPGKVVALNIDMPEACGSCGGTGICPVCGGDGKGTVDRPNDNAHSCPSCGDGGLLRDGAVVGSGQCQTCGGDGED